MKRPTARAPRSGEAIRSPFRAPATIQAIQVSIVYNSRSVRSGIVVPVYLGICLLVLLAVGTQLGTELFPQVDSGEFVLRFRAPPGSNFEITRDSPCVRCRLSKKKQAVQAASIFPWASPASKPPPTRMHNLILFMRRPTTTHRLERLASASSSINFAKAPHRTSRKNQTLTRRSIGT